MEALNLSRTEFHDSAEMVEVCVLVLIDEG